MTLVIVAIVAIVVLLALTRVGARARATVSSSARPTRERRTGGERRMRRVRVPHDRRRAPRRLDDVASAYVARIDGPGPTRSQGL